MCRSRTLLVLVNFLACAQWLLAADDQVATLIRERCQHCHGRENSNGGVRFGETISPESARSNYRMWRKVVDQVRQGTMPPSGEDPLTPRERELVLSWVRAANDTSKNPDPGPSLIRQLTREEYGQTIRDLLKFWHDPAGDAGIPEEQVVEGFANHAGSQVLESSLMERYFTAADQSLERLFTDNGTAGHRREFGVGGDVPALAKAWTQHLAKTTSTEVAATDANGEVSRLAVREVLRLFMRRAFRRPVSDEEIERHAALADKALDGGDAYPEALRKAMKSVLVSPNFLLRIENDPMNSRVARVSDHELAVRLSYFLWGSMPDDELFQRADAGALSRPEELEQQVRRMLAHGKAESLTRWFLTPWLQLPRISKSLPSQNSFPTFTRSLRDAMERETWMFCDNLRKEDRSLLDLLEADYTFVDEELASHYQLKTATVKGREFVRVTLRPEDHRGGVIAMASLLTLTSHTDRTKPTARGKWILEVLLGSPPPPPPANAGNFAPPDKERPEAKTFREKLAQHAADSNCVACHRRVDPLGFALENYDAIGAWRDSSGSGPVDNIGVLPGVGEFRGIDGLRAVLKNQQEKFVRNLVEQTIQYALGREVSYYDESAVDRIVAELAANEYRFSVLILEVVRSFPFQHRGRCEDL